MEYLDGDSRPWNSLQQHPKLHTPNFKAVRIHPASCCLCAISEDGGATGGDDSECGDGDDETELMLLSPKDIISQTPRQDEGPNNLPSTNHGSDDPGNSCENKTRDFKISFPEVERRPGQVEIRASETNIGRESGLVDGKRPNEENDAKETPFSLNSSAPLSDLGCSIDEGCLESQKPDVKLVLAAIVNEHHNFTVSGPFSGEEEFLCSPFKSQVETTAGDFLKGNDHGSNENNSILTEAPLPGTSHDGEGTEDSGESKESAPEEPSNDSLGEENTTEGENGAKKTPPCYGVIPEREREENSSLFPCQETKDNERNERVENSSLPKQPNIVTLQSSEANEWEIKHLSLTDGSMEVERDEHNLLGQFAFKRNLEDECQRTKPSEEKEEFQKNPCSDHSDFMSVSALPRERDDNEEKTEGGEDKEMTSFESNEPVREENMETKFTHQEDDPIFIRTWSPRYCLNDPMKDAVNELGMTHCPPSERSNALENDESSKLEPTLLTGDSGLHFNAQSRKEAEGGLNDETSISVHMSTVSSYTDPNLADLELTVEGERNLLAMDAELTFPEGSSQVRKYSESVYDPLPSPFGNERGEIPQILLGTVMVISDGELHPAKLFHVVYSDDEEVEDSPPQGLLSPKGGAISQQQIGRDLYPPSPDDRDLNEEGRGMSASKDILTEELPHVYECLETSRADGAAPPSDEGGAEREVGKELNSKLLMSSANATHIWKDSSNKKPSFADASDSEHVKSVCLNESAAKSAVGNDEARKEVHKKYRVSDEILDGAECQYLYNEVEGSDNNSKCTTLNEKINLPSHEAMEPSLTSYVGYSREKKLFPSSENLEISIEESLSPTDEVLFPLNEDIETFHNKVMMVSSLNEETNIFSSDEMDPALKEEVNFSRGKQFETHHSEESESPPNQNEAMESREIKALQNEEVESNQINASNENSGALHKEEFQSDEINALNEDFVASQNEEVGSGEINESIKDFEVLQNEDVESHEECHNIESRNESFEASQNEAMESREIKALQNEEVESNQINDSDEDSGAPSKEEFQSDEMNAHNEDFEDSQNEEVGSGEINESKKDFEVLQNEDVESHEECHNIKSRNESFEASQNEAMESREIKALQNEEVESNEINDSDEDSGAPSKEEFQSDEMNAHNEDFEDSQNEELGSGEINESKKDFKVLQSEYVESHKEYHNIESRSEGVDVSKNEAIESREIKALQNEEVESNEINASDNDSGALPKEKFKPDEINAHNEEVGSGGINDSKKDFEILQNEDIESHEECHNIESRNEGVEASRNEAMESREIKALQNEEVESNQISDSEEDSGAPSKEEFESNEMNAHNQDFEDSQNQKVKSFEINTSKRDFMLLQNEEMGSYELSAPSEAFESLQNEERKSHKIMVLGEDFEVAQIGKLESREINIYKEDSKSPGNEDTKSCGINDSNQEAELYELNPPSKNSESLENKEVESDEVKASNDALASHDGQVGSRMNESQNEEFGCSINEEMEFDSAKPRNEVKSKHLEDGIISDHEESVDTQESETLPIEWKDFVHSIDAEATSCLLWSQDPKFLGDEILEQTKDGNVMFVQNRNYEDKPKEVAPIQSEGESIELSGEENDIFSVRTKITPPISPDNEERGSDLAASDPEGSDLYRSNQTEMDDLQGETRGRELRDTLDEVLKLPESDFQPIDPIFNDTGSNYSIGALSERCADEDEALLEGTGRDSLLDPLPDNNDNIADEAQSEKSPALSPPHLPCPSSLHPLVGNVPIPRDEATGEVRGGTASDEWSMNPTERESAASQFVVVGKSGAIEGEPFATAALRDSPACGSVSTIAFESPSCLCALPDDGGSQVVSRDLSLIGRSRQCSDIRSCAYCHPAGETSTIRVTSAGDKSTTEDFVDKAAGSIELPPFRWEDCLLREGCNDSIEGLTVEELQDPPNRATGDAGFSGGSSPDAKLPTITEEREDMSLTWFLKTLSREMDDANAPDEEEAKNSGEEADCTLKGGIPSQLDCLDEGADVMDVTLVHSLSGSLVPDESGSISPSGSIEDDIVIMKDDDTSFVTVVTKQTPGGGEEFISRRDDEDLDDDDDARTIDSGGPELGCHDDANSLRWSTESLPTTGDSVSSTPRAHHHRSYNDSIRHKLSTFERRLSAFAFQYMFSKHSWAGKEAEIPSPPLSPLTLTKGRRPWRDVKKKLGSSRRKTSKMKVRGTEQVTTLKNIPLDSHDDAPIPLPPPGTENQRPSSLDGGAKNLFLTATHSGSLLERRRSVAEDFFRSFGKPVQGSSRRPNECLILEPSEMMVIDYPDVQVLHPGQRSAVNQRTILTLDPREPPVRGAGGVGGCPLSSSSEGAAPPLHYHPHQLHHDLPDLLRGGRSRGSVGSSVRDGSDTSSAYSGSDTMYQSVHSLDHEDVDLSGLMESVVDSDEDENLVENMESLSVQDTVRECLEKDPSDRAENDIKILLEFTERLAAFANFTLGVRRAMCQAMVFAVVEEADTILMADNEELDSWSVIINGSVEITYPDGSVQKLHMGESFGSTPTMDKMYHRGVMRSKVDDCQFVCIRQSDYCRILRQGEENTKRHEEDGVLVLVTEKSHIDTCHREANIVIKGTPERLMLHLVEVENILDTTYVEDFLLTHRKFIENSVVVADKLLEWFEDLKYQDIVTRVFLRWVQSYFTDFEMDPDMMNCLERFEEGLQRKEMTGQLFFLRMVCMTKARSRVVTLTRPSRDKPLQFSIVGRKNFGIFIASVEKGSKAEEIGLKRADQILEANGHSFSNVSRTEALEILTSTSHLEMTVKSNLHTYNDMLQTPETSQKGKSRKAAEFQANGPCHGHLDYVSSMTFNTALSPHLPHTRKESKGTSMTLKTHKLKEILASIRTKSSIIDPPVVCSDDSISSHSSTAGHLYRSRSNPDLSSTDCEESSKSEFPDHVLKVYRATDQSARFLLMNKETTAREVVMLALNLFNIAEASQNYALYEVSVTEGAPNEQNVVKQKRLPDSLQNLAERIGLSSRYYLKSVTSSQNLCPDEVVNELIRESQVSILQLNSVVELAIQVTLEDFAVFRQIEPTEYIDSLFKIKSKYGTPSLSKFEEISNKELYWVCTEVCREHNIHKRGKIIKQFIKIAKYCKDFNNFNSMFAILSGLGNASVNRLRQTWARVPNRYRKIFSDLETVMDPSQNMKNYRKLASSSFSQSPMIPFYPIVKKDLLFLNEGNDDEVDGLINFEKLRNISKSIRKLGEMCSTKYCPNKMLEKLGQPQSTAMTAMNQGITGSQQSSTVNRRKKASALPDKKKMFEEAQMVRRVKAYLSQLKVITDEDTLLKMSHECEPPSNAFGSNHQTSVSSHSSASSSQQNSSGSNSAPPSNPQIRRRPHSPTPSTTSSNSSNSHTSEGKKPHARFGAASPTSQRKMLSLAENTKKPYHGPRPPSSATSLTQTALSPNPSPGAPRRGPAPGIPVNPPCAPTIRGSHERSHSDTPVNSVDLNAESSSVTSFANLRKSHTSGSMTSSDCHGGQGETDSGISTHFDCHSSSSLEGGGGPAYEGPFAPSPPSPPPPHRRFSHQPVSLKPPFPHAVAVLPPNPLPAACGGSRLLRRGVNNGPPDYTSTMRIQQLGRALSHDSVPYYPHSRHEDEEDEAQVSAV